MTIAISVKIGEGLVYAADSTSSLFTTVDGVNQLTQSFHHAQKLIQVRDFPIGVLTYGLGLIGTRNIESLVAEFQSEVLKDNQPDHNVKQIAEGLRDFFVERYEAAFPPPAAPNEGEEVPPDNRPKLGIVIGGYTEHKFDPEEYSFELPSRVLHERDQDNGVKWWGQVAALQRLFFGFDMRLWDWMVDKGLEAENVPPLFEELRERLAWGIHFDGMPLQDAIDFSGFLANISIGHSRFFLGPPVCGGHVDVATISHKGFEWVRRKENHVKADSVFF